MRQLYVALAIAALATACGSSGDSSNNQGEIDAAPEPVGECGNGIVEGTEECDDGNPTDDDACLRTCEFACGDGVVNSVEHCDTAIGSGDPGACPTDCDDSDACTIDTLAGAECEAACEHGSITANVDDDGCCPSGSTSVDDNDCAVGCGNGVVESGETCDTAIASGNPGACPDLATCNDTIACTADSVANAGTCTAACVNTDITTPTDNDGCCPSGANPGNDDDCTGAVCGDGVVTAPEACDTAIAAGDAGACPTLSDCTDSDPCTNNGVSQAGTCNAVCTTQNITVPTDDDGCCPPAANEQTDNDCQPVCPNNVIETGETCDDGNVIPGDGCDENCQTEVVATTFRFTDLDLRDPHTVIDIFGCRDLTDTTFFGFSSNGEFQDSIQMDGDGDGLLDLSPLVLFNPLDQVSTTTPMEVIFADCTSPMSSTTCTGGTSTPSTATNMSSGTCLGVLSGTTTGYTPAIVTSSASGVAACFSSGSETLTIDLSGIVVTLEDARIAGRYSGSPATGLVNGLVRGFISEANADATILPSSLPVVGGQPLSSILPGGTGNCSSGDDRDIGPDGSTVGWYFYMNFVATEVPYTP